MSDTVFKKVDYQSSKLVDDIELGEIGLPDIQRPFVWEAAKIRDLFDSMYRGYPVGTSCFGRAAPSPEPGRSAPDKQLAPKPPIVDGQQRLTSLFAVMKRDRSGRTTQHGRPDRIPAPRWRVLRRGCGDRAESLVPQRHQRGLVTSQLQGDHRVPGTPPRNRRGARRQRTQSPRPQPASRPEGYPFTALVLGAEIAEEQVAEVFVRINSKGKNLNQADFILTLMSVFLGRGPHGTRTVVAGGAIRRRPGTRTPSSARRSDQLLRVGIALGFRRGRLEDAYSVLRGRDPRNGKISQTRGAFNSLVSRRRRRAYKNPDPPAHQRQQPRTPANHHRLNRT